MGQMNGLFSAEQRINPYAKRKKAPGKRPDPPPEI